MTRALAIQLGVAAGAGAAGITLLLRPSIARRLIGIADSEAATYALRIAGMMLAALGLFLAGFGLSLWSAP